MDKCPECGAKVNPSDKRCSKCGTKLEEKKPKSKLIIAIAIIVVIIAVISVFAVTSLSNTGEVKQADTQKTTANVTHDNSNATSNTTFWASAKSDKFHYPDCEWAQKIGNSNKIIYNSRQEAIDDGKSPCSVCNP